MSEPFTDLTDKKQIIHLSELDQAHIEVQAALNKLVWNNEELRKQLVENPKKIMEEHLGIKFEPNINVIIIDQLDPNTAYYVLPPHPNKTIGKEFTPEELDFIAGGMSLLDPKMLSIYGESEVGLRTIMGKQLQSQLPDYYRDQIGKTIESFKKKK